MITTPKKSQESFLTSTENVHYVETIPNVSFLNTIRNSGYNNYTAIADIIDNALEPDIKSSKVAIISESDSKGLYPFKFIKIIDDGCGMDFLTLVEALKLGSNTGKSRKDDLGSYGTGLKAAALSIGKKFTIQTKSIDDKFYIADFDLDDIQSRGCYSIPIREGNNNEYIEFKRLTNSDNGTIITLLKLDRLSNSNVTDFSNNLSNNLGLYYASFIDEKDIVITINNKEVISFDPMFRKESYTTRLSKHNEIFNHKGKDYVFNVFYLAKTNFKKHLEIGRSAKHAGIYVYRNRRLVGAGLDLGIVGKGSDGYRHGLRIELLTDGDDDILFGSTFMKMIHEKDKTEIDQSFRDSAREALKSYIDSATILEGKGKGKQLEEDEKKIWDEIMVDINKNKLIDTDKFGKNKKTETPPDRKEIKNPGRNKFSHRKRDDAFAKWNNVNLGEFGPVFNMTKEDGKNVIHMNIDHIFWEEFLRDASFETKNIIARLFVSISLSLNSVHYYDDEDKKVLMQEYFAEMSNQLRKLIKA
jgi:hypothetical protein